MPEDKPAPEDDASMPDDVEILYVGPAQGEAEVEPTSERGLAPVETPELEAEVERLEAEAQQYRDLYLRKLADFDNFRKRLEREREELRRTAGEVVMRELVPVLDNFERALLVSEEADAAAFRQGVTMISRQLWDTLRRQGLERIAPEQEPFDPLYHEAVQRVEESGQEPGTVVSVLAKGYLFAGRLLRPALVAVAVPTDPLTTVAAATGPGEGEQGT